MTLAFLDCFSGVAGDMWVGALLDLGLPLADLQNAVDGMGLGGVRLQASPVARAGLRGVHFEVVVERPAATHRHLADIVRIIEGADLPVPVRERAVRVFTRLGEVEAHVHGTEVERVHFHEVGADDTIVDVVGVVLGCHLLGIEEVFSSAVVTGRGTVRCEHGEMPVPAPGALGNLVGVPLRSGGPEGECVTPTGAALLAELVDEFEPVLDWVPERIGYGAGTRDDPAHPNLLRVTLGERTRATSRDSLVEIRCQLDTATGEELGYLIDTALARGAVDVFATAVQMKKGRPGFVLTLLSDDARRPELESWLLEESTTLGVRSHRVERAVLPRWQETVETSLGPVLVKVARLPSGAVVRRPEDAELRRLARELGLGRREVLRRITPSLG